MQCNVFVGFWLSITQITVKCMCDSFIISVYKLVIEVICVMLSAGFSLF